MATTTRIQRSYDHRLRELVRSTGDIQYAIRRGVPRSTAHGWLKSPQTEVVTLAVIDTDVLRLQQEVLTLRRRVARLLAVLRLLVVLLRLSGFSLASTRIPNGAGKHTLMRAIERSRTVLPLRIVLRVLRLY
jgi:putative transposase